MLLNGSEVRQSPCRTTLTMIIGLVEYQRIWHNYNKSQLLGFLFLLVDGDILTLLALNGGHPQQTYFLGLKM